MLCTFYTSIYKKVALILCISLAVVGCDLANESSNSPPVETQIISESGKSTSSAFDVAITLDADNSTRKGRAHNHCWKNECWEVVWCGHNVCAGSWSWSDFPHTGQFNFTWKGVSEKCAGSPPYQLRVNGQAVTSGEISQWGSCSECPDAAGNFNVFKDYDLGNHKINKGDTITLWAQTEFLCGINSAGAYAAHDNIMINGKATE